MVWGELRFCYSFCRFPGRKLDLLALLLEIFQEIVIRFPSLHFSGSTSDLSEGLHLPVNGSAALYLHSFRTLQGYVFLSTFYHCFYWFIPKPLLLAPQFEPTPPNRPCKALCGWRNLTKLLHNEHQCKELIHLYHYKCALLHPRCPSAPQSPWPRSLLLLMCLRKMLFLAISRLLLFCHALYCSHAKTKY